MQTGNVGRDELPGAASEHRGEPARGVAVLWDESFLWGVMAHRALREAGLAFDLVRSDQVRRGALRGYRMLLVPGGWATHKMTSLGDAGADAVQQFVAGGGSYLGICGGAGLATVDGIGLLGVKRQSGPERVPSFSGRVRLTLADDPLWRGVGDPIFHAWWPSQLAVADPGVRVLASYAGALPDAFSSDLNVGDVSRDSGWESLESLYDMRLDPARLRGNPAVLEGSFGAGRVILSLVHLDTVGDTNGGTVLANLWDAVSGERARADIPTTGLDIRDRARPEAGEGQAAKERALRALAPLERGVEELIAVGVRNFLWHWRTPLLLAWRRGVRGLECCTLHVLVREIAARVRARDAISPALASAISSLPTSLAPFLDEAARLLVLERRAMMKGLVTFKRCEDEEIRGIRERLFSASKSHGGRFKEVILALDAVLYALLSIERGM
jgi:hypothetical protein